MCNKERVPVVAQLLLVHARYIEGPVQQRSAANLVRQPADLQVSDSCLCVCEMTSLGRHWTPSKLCILVARHIFLTSCNTTNPRGLCAHPVLIIFQSTIIT